MGRPLYKFREKKKFNSVCQYPLNAYSSFIYNFLGIYLYNVHPIMSFSLYILGLVSFFWWSYQQYTIQCIDLGLITYLYSWGLINYFELNFITELFILHLCILSIFVIKPEYLKYIHLSCISLSAIILISTFKIAPIILFIISGYCKFRIDYIGTMLFHFITAMALYLLVL